MKNIVYILMSLSFLVFTSCSHMGNHHGHSCCDKKSEVCKDGCKADKSCCKDKCGKCDGKSSCKDGKCDGKSSCKDGSCDNHKSA